MSKYTFVTNCTAANGDDINEMVDLPLNEEYETAEFLNGPAKAAGLVEDITSMLGYRDAAEMTLDWHISCHSSYYQGIPCLYVDHSRIEHIFVPVARAHETLDHADSQVRQDVLLELEELLDEFEPWLEAKTKHDEYEALKHFVQAHETEFRDHRLLLSSLFTYSNPHLALVAQLDHELLLSQAPDAPELDWDDDVSMTP